MFSLSALAVLIRFLYVMGLDFQDTIHLERTKLPAQITWDDWGIRTGACWVWSCCYGIVEEGGDREGGAIFSWDYGHDLDNSISKLLVSITK